LHRHPAAAIPPLTILGPGLPRRRRPSIFARDRFVLAVVAPDHINGNEMDGEDTKLQLRRALVLSLFIIVMISDFVFAFAGSMSPPQILFESIPSFIFPQLREISHVISAVAVWLLQLVLFVAIIVYFVRILKARAYFALTIAILIISTIIPITYLGYNHIVEYNLAKSRIVVEEFLKYPTGSDIKYDDVSIFTEIESHHFDKNDIALRSSLPMLASYEFKVDNKSLLPFIVQITWDDRKPMLFAYREKR
jgi:hypothetical protein